MATKEDVLKLLRDAEIEHDPATKKADLIALLPEEQRAKFLASQDDENKVVLSERELRWQAYLAIAEAEAAKNGVSHVFEAQRKNGEFDKVPDCFV